MKSATTSKKFPAKPKEWEAVITAAPGKDRLATPKANAVLAKTVVVDKGGYPAVRPALVEKRRQSQPGPKHSPTKRSMVTPLSKSRAASELQRYRASGTLRPGAELV